MAERLPKLRQDDRWVDRSAAERAAYAAVNVKDDSIHVSSSLDEIEANATVQAFETPLRICIGNELKGRKVGIRYSLFGSNLRQPIKGRLRLLC